MNQLPEKNEPKAEQLIPPRPNLGPEPCSASGNRSGAPGWLALAVVLVGLGLWLRSRFRRRSASRELKIVEDSTPADPSPRQRLIVQSDQIREALVRAFGSAWRSKTTEEIGEDDALLQKLEPAEFDRLIDFLRLADRAKFADSEPEAVEDWESWTTAIIDRLAALKPS